MRNHLFFLAFVFGDDFGPQRMSNHSSEYVSCVRINGIPILPPVLTEEERQQCRIYKQQAINIEKKLQEKRLREKKRLESVEEEESILESDVTEDVTSSGAMEDATSSGAMEVMAFIRKALGDSHDLDEVKFLISQVGEELIKRRSIGSHDSTYNDVDSLSLNQNADLSNLDADGNYFDKKSDESILIDGHKTEAEKLDQEPEAILENSAFEINEPKNIDFVINVTGNQSVLDKTDDMSRNQILMDTQNEKMYSESGVITPPKLIRSNSYTLESPSPTVLVYLKSLTLGNCSERVEVSSNVVKNLNNYWEEESLKENLSCPALLKADDDVNKNLKRLKIDTIDYQCNVRNDEFENGLGELKSLENYSNETSQEKLQAATIIQAAARGFLVRRLMKTQKINDLKIIIKEAVLCAWSLYGEQAVSPADIQLHKRIIQQVTAACYELHCIFFNWSTADRMALIRSDREKMKNPKAKFRASRERKMSESNSVSSSIRSKSASSISGISRSSTPLQRPTTLPSNIRRKVNYQPYKDS